MRKIYLFMLLAFFGSLSANAQVLFTESFEGSDTYLPDGWTAVNAGAGPYGWGLVDNPTAVANSLFSTPYGNNYLIYLYDEDYPANAWIVSKRVNLVAGQQYSVNFKYRVASSNYPEKMKVTVGTDSLVSAQTTVLWNNNGATNLTQTAWTSATATFTPTTSGVYFFGFNCYSDADKWALGLDDITVKAVAQNDLSVSYVYALGTTGSGFPTTVKALVANVGSNVATNAQFTVTVSGANTYTNTITIPTINPGQSGIITFPNFATNTVGQNTITVSAASDDDNTNNSASTGQTITANSVNFASSTAVPTGAVNAGANVKFVGKLFAGNSNNVSQFNVYFTAAGNLYDVVLFDRAAATGLPNNQVWTQTGLTSTVGWNNITVPNVPVTDTFFIGVVQKGAQLALGYLQESPLRSNSFFLNSGTSWFDLSNNPANVFRAMMGVTMQNVLPVTLVDFKAERKGTTNQLTWTTATEQNNAGFQVERSANGKDFTTLSFVNSKGDNGFSNATLTYAFTDETPLAGVNYYRLKQTDKDGRFEYSKTVKVANSSLMKFEIVNVYPNPAKDQVRLILNSVASDKVSVAITDLSGKLISNQAASVKTGDNEVVLNVSALSAGSYFITVTSGNGEKLNTKFIKQ